MAKGNSIAVAILLAVSFAAVESSTIFKETRYSASGCANSAKTDTKYYQGTTCASYNSDKGWYISRRISSGSLITEIFNMTCCNGAPLISDKKNATCMEDDDGGVKVWKTYETTTGLAYWKSTSFPNASCTGTQSAVYTLIVGVCSGKKIHTCDGTTATETEYTDVDCTAGATQKWSIAVGGCLMEKHKILSCHTASGVTMASISSALFPSPLIGVMLVLTILRNVLK